MLRLFNLQLFAEGEGADSSAESTGESAVGSSIEAKGEETPAFIPEKAKEMWKKAKENEKAKAKVSAEPTPTEEPKPPVQEDAPKHIPFKDLIKSEEYKEEHRAYMDKTISDRLKKYKGIEESNTKMSQVLQVVAQKYNLDPNSEDYLDKLASAVNKDDAFVEDYAIEHNLSNEEARKQIEMRRKLDNYEADRIRREEEAETNRRTQRLFMAAEKVKAVYPNFDLDAEMQNERFVRLCQATNEDVMAAYEIIHRDEIKALQAQAMAQRATQQVANSVASNASRPIENGLSNRSAAVVQTNYRGMTLEQIRAQAAEFRRRKQG